jgi:hypothetical protein
MIDYVIDNDRCSSATGRVQQLSSEADVPADVPAVPVVVHAKKAG